jgi:glycosyltransferase involved in cell wall biosynthesis
MLARLFLFVLLISSSLFANNPLTVHIFTHFNGIGLETDERILRAAIEKLGHNVRSFNWDDRNQIEADVNIFLEQILPDKIPFGKRNWLIPNPEWYVQDIALLDKMDLILCRTQQSISIFKQKYPIFYLGFTSPDAYRPEVQKDYSLCVHLPGASNFQKGTKEVFRVWRHYPGLPKLTLVDWTATIHSSQPNLEIIPYKLAENDYRILQNQGGIHICPSYAEGFGHYILEAMSTGAVLLTTNGLPMNELVKDKRCLLPVTTVEPYRLGVRYNIARLYMRDRIQAIMKLSNEEKAEIGAANRREYLRRTKEFHQRLAILMEKASTELKP